MVPLPRESQNYNNISSYSRFLFPLSPISLPQLSFQLQFVQNSKNCFSSSSEHSSFRLFVNTLSLQSTGDHTNRGNQAKCRRQTNERKRNGSKDPKDECTITQLCYLAWCCLQLIYSSLSLFSPRRTDHHPFLCPVNIQEGRCLGINKKSKCCPSRVKTGANCCQSLQHQSYQTIVSFLDQKSRCFSPWA